MDKQMQARISSQSSAKPEIKIGISECLLGREVRFNGGHKRFRLCTDDWANVFEFVPVCPEVEIGLPVPREPIRLMETSPGQIEVVNVTDSTQKHTAQLQALGIEKAQTMTDISGFIFTPKSPSCGLHGVKVYLKNGYSNGSRGGAFAEAFRSANPLLPVEDSGRLNDAGLRENFMMRVFLYAKWQKLLQEGISAKSLLAFHSKEKLLVMAHCLVTYKKLGRLLADLRDKNVDTVADTYIHCLMLALARPTTRARNANALSHIQGYLKRSLGGYEKQALADIINDYRTGRVPMVVPITLLQHLLQKHEEANGVDYILTQSYLQPYPKNLGLRNAI